MNEAVGGKQRVVALDLLRGAAVAGMILANGPGSWSHIYGPLEHAPWHGWTLTDMVFPTFLFSVGMAIGLSFPRALSSPDQRRTLWVRALRRAAALMALGLFLNLLPYFDVAHLRLPGVLQRIAVCYVLALAIVIGMGSRQSEGRTALRSGVIAAVIVGVLLLYWALLMLVPVPGIGTGRLDEAGNLAGWVDRTVLTVSHMWALGKDAAGQVVYDPEGLLSTLPATANVLFGVLATAAYRQGFTPLRIALVGAALLLLGTCLDPLLPINKRLWTSSFALVSSGFSFVLFALLAAVARSGVAPWLLTPLKIFGANAILAYMISELIAVFASLHLLPHGHTLQQWGFAQAQLLTSDLRLASLLCAVAILLLVLGLLAPLHRRAIHFRL
jgi:predicted acyltransferase